MVHFLYSVPADDLQQSPCHTTCSTSKGTCCQGGIVPCQPRAAFLQDVVYHAFLHVTGHFCCQLHKYAHWPLNGACFKTFRACRAFLCDSLLSTSVCTVLTNRTRNLMSSRRRVSDRQGYHTSLGCQMAVLFTRYASSARPSSSSGCWVDCHTVSRIVSERRLNSYCRLMHASCHARHNNYCPLINSSMYVSVTGAELHGQGSPSCQLGGGSQQTHMKLYVCT